MITMRDMFTLFTLTTFLGVLFIAIWLGVSITLSRVLIALAASPFLGGAFMFGTIWLAGWSDDRARARRIARAKARKGEGA